jgi:nicotinate-nucleotide--dimethylbenzimidazole phosphoribosyltransferase
VFDCNSDHRQITREGLPPATLATVAIVSWTRPVPLIGDATSAQERSADPRGWAFPEEARTSFREIVAARRDVRRFRPDEVPGDVLRRVLEAAHAAPSVGHSQPWRFVIVRDDRAREEAARLADRERLVQAEQLEGESARRLKDLKLEGIREAPLGIVVCCDRRAPAAGVLGRATFPDADLWSCACAIQNLWLAARAEGLGLGWVTLFRPADLQQLLNLPDGVQTLGWLCLGWPDERPPAPGLERAGWSRKAPLDDVLVEDRWPDSDRTPPVSHLRAPGQERVVTVRDDADQLLTPPDSLGVLDRALDRVLALPTPLNAGTLVLVGAAHPVVRHQVSAYENAVGVEVLRAAVAGEALGVATARANGLGALVVDAGIGRQLVEGAIDARPEGLLGDLLTSDALAAADVARLIALGRRLGYDAGQEGVVALGEVGIGNTTVAAALTAALLDRPAAEVVGLGAGADSAMLARKTEVVDGARQRVRSSGTGAAGPLEILGSLGGAEFAVLTGVTLGAAEAGAAVVLDGLATSVAALVAVRVEPAVAAHLVAGHRSREAAHALVLTELGLEPLLDLRLRAGEGVGACLAVGLLRAARAARQETGRTHPEPPPA